MELEGGGRGVNGKEVLISFQARSWRRQLRGQHPLWKRVIQGGTPLGKHNLGTNLSTGRVLQMSSHWVKSCAAGEQAEPQNGVLWTVSFPWLSPPFTEAL